MPINKPALDANGKTRWHNAKIKYKNNELKLIEYYYKIPYRLRKYYGAPKSYTYRKKRKK